MDIELGYLSDPECYVCLDHISPDSKSIRLVCCSKTVHQACFLEWFIRKGIDVNCPICRTCINYKNMVSLDDFINFLENKQYAFSLSQKHNIQAIFYHVYKINIGELIIDNEAYCMAYIANPLFLIIFFFIIITLVCLCLYTINHMFKY
jgi:hypothetical protein